MPRGARPGELRRADIEPEPFSIVRSTHGTTEVVALAGELDMVNAPTVADALDTLVADGRQVVVDLTELTFIDSSGIHALVRPRGHEGAIELVCPPGNIRRVLELTKLQNVLQVHDTLGEALAAAA